MNIGEYLLRRSRGKYSPIFTEPEANNCFSEYHRESNNQLSKVFIYFVSGSRAPINSDTRRSNDFTNRFY